MKISNNAVAFIMAILWLGTWTYVSIEPTPFSSSFKNDSGIISQHPGWYDQYMAMKANDEGKIPNGLLSKWKKQDVISSKKPDSTGLTALKELGPFSVGGRTRAIQVDRTNQEHVLAGAVSGGLWQSYDGGENWEAQNDMADNLSITSLAQSPLNPDLIYYGTGEAISNSADVPGEGIYRSLDGGESFAPLPNTLNDQFTAVWEIKAARNQAGVFYVSTRQGSLFRFTDSGASFNEVFQASGNNSSITDIEILPNSTVFITVWGEGIFKSSDGKGNFTKVNQSFPSGNFSRVEMAYCREKPNVLYAVFSSDPRRTGARNGLTGVWKSEDGGQNWQEISNPSNRNDVSYRLSNYALMIGVKPNDPNSLVIGSVNAAFSRTGGNAWFRLRESHVDYHKITHGPNSNNDFLVGNDGGVYRYSWTNLNPENLNQGYQVTQFYGGHYYPDSNEVIGGTQDNGTQGFNRGSSKEEFIRYFGGDGSFCAVSQENPDTGFVSTQRGRIHRSTDMTSTKPSFTSVYGDMDKNNDDEIDDDVWFINPFEINAAAENQIFFTTKDKVWLTTDWANNWKPLTENLLWGTPYNTAISDHENPIVFIHGDRGLFYRMNDPLNSDVGDEINLRNSLPQSVRRHFLRSLKIHPEDSSILYGGFSNLEDEPRIWRITEAMSNEPQWESIHGDLPTTLPVNSVAVHPAMPDSFLIAGTDFGLYITRDQGQHWVKEEEIPNVSVHQIRVRPSDNRLFVYTHGRGIWKANLPSPVLDTTEKENEEQNPKDSTSENNIEAFKVGPNPTAGDIRVKIPFEDDDNEKAQASLYSMGGKILLEKTITNSPDPQLNLATLSSGFYILKVSTPQNDHFAKIWLK